MNKMGLSQQYKNGLILGNLLLCSLHYWIKEKNGIIDIEKCHSTKFSVHAW